MPTFACFASAPSKVWCLVTAPDGHAAMKTADSTCNHTFGSSYLVDSPAGLEQLSKSNGDFLGAFIYTKPPPPLYQARPSRVATDWEVWRTGGDLIATTATKERAERIARLLCAESDRLLNEAPK